MYSAILLAGEVSHVKEVSLVVSLDAARFAFHLFRGYILKSDGGLPLSFFLDERRGEPDEKLAVRCMSQPGCAEKLPLALVAQTSATLMALVGLVGSSGRGRVEMVHAPDLSLWIRIDGGVAVNRDVLDLYFLPHVDPGSLTLDELLSGLGKPYSVATLATENTTLTVWENPF